MKLAEILYHKNKNDLQLMVKMIDVCKGRTRKDDLVECLCQAMLTPESLGKLWAQLDDLSQKAVAAAYHNAGEFNATAFLAQYGRLPARPQSRWFWQSQPILLDLFIYQEHIPDDLMPLLEPLAPAPERFQLKGISQPPKTVTTAAGHQVELICAETEKAGQHDLLAYLRSFAQGDVNTTSSSSKLTKSSADKLLSNSLEGDFLPLPEKYRATRTIRPNGLDTFARAGELVDHRDHLSPAGQEYMQTQDPELLLDAFETWTHKNFYDELLRITALKGLKAKHTHLSNVAKRREAVVEALSWCPVDVWIDIQDFYRAVKIWHFDFDVETTFYSNLYIGSKEYGTLHGETYWTVVKGLYINVIIWEMLGSLGAVDLLYTEPEQANLNLRADYLYYDEPYISLYDGLRYFRVNNLGAYLLGQASEYVPAVQLAPTLFVISPDLRVTLTEPDLFTPNDQHQLELMAVPLKKGQYQLDNQQLLSSIEAGSDWQNLRDFVTTRHSGPVPAEVFAWFDRLQQNSRAFKTGGKALFIKVKSSELIDLALTDPVLKKFCKQVDRRTLVVSSSKERALRARLKELDYVLAG